MNCQCYNFVMKAIGLIDCNNFFVSCERVFRPDLTKRPVVVLSGQNGCVVARSEEIKDMGIKMAVPYFQIKDILEKSKTTIFISNFPLYKSISKRVFEIVKSELGEIERYSIDECFFSIDTVDCEEKLMSLRQKIFDQIGIPVSIGIGPSKTIAKYANQLAKKTNEIVVLSDSLWTEKATEVPLSMLWGVGAGRSKKFREANINTVRDLLETEDRIVQKLFGVEGVRLKQEVSGEYCKSKPKTSDNTQKSLMSTRSFDKATTSKDYLRSALSFHANKAVSELYGLGLFAQSIRVLIYPSRYGDYSLQGSSVEVIFTKPINNIFTIEKAAMNALETGFKPGVPYKKAGIILSGLVDSSAVSLSLFDTDTSQDGLTSTIFEINKKYKKSLLKLSSTTQKNNVTSPRSELMSPRYTTNWTEIKRVKC